MADETTSVTLPSDSPKAVELRLGVHGGDVDLIRRLLSDNLDLARARFRARGGTSTALHFVTDWLGYFPNGPQLVHVLIEAGADPNALTTGRGSDRPGPGSETPLHYAAGSADVDVAAPLIDRVEKGLARRCPRDVAPIGRSICARDRRRAGFAGMAVHRHSARSRRPKP
jgi:hypothetical protein